MNAPLLPAFPTFAEAFRVWFRIGCLSFGGPAGQIALLHREGWTSAAGCPTRASSAR